MHNLLLALSGSIISPDFWQNLWQQFLGALDALKTIFVFINIALIFGFFALLIKVWETRPKFAYRFKSEKKILTLGKAVFGERWQLIITKIQSPSVSSESLKIAVIEADKLADDALKNMGFKGEHMADRLVQLRPEDLKSLERLWRAHRLRNDLVHTPGFQISPKEAKSAIEDYGAFFKEIELI